jgi:hypothetical protein
MTAVKTAQSRPKRPFSAQRAGREGQFQRLRPCLAGHKPNEQHRRATEPRCGGRILAASPKAAALALGASVAGARVHAMTATCRLNFGAIRTRPEACSPERRECRGTVEDGGMLVLIILALPLGALFAWLLWRAHADGDRRQTRSPSGSIPCAAPSCGRDDRHSPRACAARSTSRLPSLRPAHCRARHRYRPAGRCPHADSRQ